MAFINYVTKQDTGINKTRLKGSKQTRRRTRKERRRIGVDEEENRTGDQTDNPGRRNAGRDDEGASVVEANEGTTLQKNQQNCR